MLQFAVSIANEKRLQFCECFIRSPNAVIFQDYIFHFCLIKSNFFIIFQSQLIVSFSSFHRTIFIVRFRLWKVFDYAIFAIQRLNWFVIVVGIHIVPEIASETIGPNIKWCAFRCRKLMKNSETKIFRKISLHIAFDLHWWLIFGWLLNAFTYFVFSDHWWNHWTRQHQNHLRNS